MATREKSKKTDSPVPTSESSSATATATINNPPSTPTTKPGTPIKLKRMPGRKKIIKPGAENEDAESNISEDTQSSTTSETPKTPNTRKRQAKDKDKEEDTANGEVKEKEEEAKPEENPKEKVEAAESVIKKKRQIKPPNKDLEPIVKRKVKGVTKRKVVLAHKTAIGNKVKKNLRSGPKTDVKKVVNDQSNVKPVKKISMRGAHLRRKPKANEKAEKDDEKEKDVEKEEKEEKIKEKEKEEEKKDQQDEEANDKEVKEIIGAEDPKNDHDVEMEELLTTIKTEKEEILVDDKNDFGPVDPSSIVAPSLQNVRRSMRQRRSTFKDLESPLTTRKRHSNAEVKQEKLDGEKLSNVSDDSGTKQIHIDIKSALSEETPEVIEKDASLSPELVSEELDTESVQQFLESNKPHFLENNLGIEQDPKLGEIVKVQEKNKNEIKDDCEKMDVDNNDESDKNDKEMKGKDDDEKKEELGSSEIKENGDEKQGDVKETDNSDKDQEMSENTQITEILNETVTVEDTSTKQNIIIDGAIVASKESSNDSHEKDSTKPMDDSQVESSNTTNSKPEKPEKVTEKSEKPEKITEKPEKSEKPEKIAEKPEKEVLKSKKKPENVEHPEKSLEKSENPAKKLEKPENPAKKLEKPENSVKVAEKPGKAQQKSEKVRKTSENSETPGKAPEKVENSGKSSGKTRKTSENPEKSSEKSETPGKTPDKPDDPEKPDLKLEIKVENIEEAMEESEENKENKVDATMSPKSEENIPELNESLENLKQKESHFLSLGLLTHKAADEAKIAKQKRKEELAKTAVNYSSGSSSSSYGMRSSKNKEKNGNNGNSGNSEQYTGTLKTVIKLNKSGKEEKRKGRLPLKMTFQKSKSRHDRDSNGSSASENSFYTIHNEKDPLAGTECHGGNSRKSHNRSHTTTHDKDNLASNIESEPSKEIEKSLVIPEKASSFKVHPERICQDQCFYCGGKFGLYDTPCHIAQIKSTERQNKILANEEKLTKDNCLCDACFRHVDRRANCPGYKKRLSASAAYQQQSQQEQEHREDRSQSKSPDKQQSQGQQQKQMDPKVQQLNVKCDVSNCCELGSHTIRKKWLLKVRKSILKAIDVDMDNVGNTTGTVAICEQHYEAISHLMICAVCKRKLAKNHIFYISQDVPRLEQLIKEQGLNIKLPNTTMVVCKLCRYYANLLIKPPEEKTQKAEFVQNYTKKLLQHNYNAATYESNSRMEEEDDVQEVPMEPGNITLTIKNGKIQPNKSLEVIKTTTTNQFDHKSTNEVTISMKNSPAGRIVLDDDVMVGYDVPMMDPPSPPASYIENPRYKGKHGPPPKLTAAAPPPQQKPPPSPQMNRQRTPVDHGDMARALKANPNISMRELFPGEEEMGLNINIPFNIPGTVRTPEGWYKTQTTLQYDEQTKNLWDELQRPYGNQSSFIRHLILLEKYFRNGDLMLSQSASSSASSYAESVRNRLRSYDNIPSNQNQNQISIPGGSTTAFSNEITIIPASKMRKQLDQLTITPATLTRTNMQDQHGQKRKIAQVDLHNSPKQKEKSVRVEESPKKMPPPPELIKLNKNSGMEKNKVNSPPPTFPSSITITPSITVAQNDAPANPEKPEKPQDVIVLSDQLSPAELKEKGWRPTLIPITTTSQTALNSKGPLYQTVDGRRLPALVQVMSGGKPYHISIHDYNRMCMIRREKLQQQLAQKRSGQNNPNLSVTPVSKSGSTGGVKSSTAGAPKMVSIPNQILEQNSLIPISQHQNQNQHQNSVANHHTKKQSNGGNNNSTPIKKPPPPPPPGLQSSMASFFAQQNSALSSLAKTVSALSGPIQSTMVAGPPPSMETLMKHTPWMWGSDGEITADAAQSLATLANLTALNVGGGILVDNSAASLLSKIPKSLTVIPQQRKMSGEEQRHSAS